jgi:transcriptional regulator with GAF, ATPase, and Fis domain
VQADLAKGSRINNEVFSAIRDINETLSLTNEPGQLVNMSLDTLTQVMGIECCWIQTVDGARHHRLTAERGLSPAMQSELAAMDKDQGFAGDIIGMGHRIVVPDLAADGAYGLGSFREAGFKWLVAVPLMTYRVHGILGIASRNKKLFKKETPDLAMVIGGLIGSALNKSHLFHKALKKEKPAPAKAEAPVEPPPENVPAAVEAEAPPPKESPAPPEATAKAPGEMKSTAQKRSAPLREKPSSRREERPFDAHARRLKKFRGAHKPGQ